MPAFRERHSRGTYIALYQKAQANGWRWNRASRVWRHRELCLEAPTIHRVIDFIDGRIDHPQLAEVTARILERRLRAAEHDERAWCSSIRDVALSRREPFVADEWRA